MRSIHGVYGGSLLAVFCMISISAAQVRVPEPRPGARPAPAAAAAVVAQSPDQQIATCLRGGAQNEVELAKFAQERAKSDSVKEFAAKMHKEHSQQAEKLARWANAADTARPEIREETRREVRKEPADDKPRDDKRRDDAPKDKKEDARDDRAPDRAVERAAERAEERREDRDEAREDRREVREERRDVIRTAVANRAFNWVTIHKEMGDECLKNTKEELGRYKGDDFDKAYMGQQIGAHMHMVTSLTVLKKYASPQLAEQLEMDLKTAEDHLTQAREIMKEQKDQGSSRGEDGRNEK